MEYCYDKLQMCWFNSIPSILNMLGKIWEILREILKVMLICSAFGVLLLFAVMIVGFINDGIQHADYCYSELNNFGKCLENGVVGWIYVVISAFFLLLPISVSGSFIDISEFIFKINKQPLLRRFILISFISIFFVGWIFLAPTIGLSFNKIKSGTHTCTNYLDTFVWCGIFGNFAMMLPTLLILIIRGIIYIHINYNFKNIFINCLEFLLICCSSGNLCPNNNNKSTSIV